MALAIPRDAVADDTLITKLYSRLKAVLPDSYQIYQHLSVDTFSYGSLFLLQKDKHSILVYICEEAKDDDENKLTNQTAREILAIKSDVFEELLQFRHTLIPQQLAKHAAFLLPIIMVFPYAAQSNLQVSIKSRGLYLFGRNILIPEKFASLASKCLGKQLSDYVLDFLRMRFSPESAISRSESLFSMQQQDRPELDGFLLSGEQEFALKQDLVLTAENKSSKQFNLRLIHGASGSGKSVVLLHRAKLLRDLYPDKKILVLTHNKAINHYLKSRYKNLFDQKEGANECRPFMEWCLRHWKGSRRFVYEDEVSDVLAQMLSRHLKGTVFTANLLLREIKFIKDRLIFKEKTYLQADRSGQGFSLDYEMRSIVWRVLLDFDMELKSRDILLWADLPRLLWQDLEEDSIQLDSYDHVLIDEAQYFAPIWFELIKQVIKPEIGQLFMVADPDQGFLNRRLNWKETGIDLRDRTFRLQRNYRSNPNILKAADEFRFNRIPEETVHLLPAKACNATAEKECKAPTLLHFHSSKDEKNRLFSEVHRLLQQGVRPQDILVLEAGSFKVRPLLQELKKTLKQPACILTDPYWDEKALRICELDAATGLESPIVFITGLQALFDEENKVTMSDRERHALVIENTRKLYMGMTRASEQLILMMTSDRIPESLMIKEIDRPTVSKIKKRASVEYLHS